MSECLNFTHNLSHNRLVLLYFCFLSDDRCVRAMVLEGCRCVQSVVGEPVAKLPPDH
jgi:hypothetical protein